MDYIVLACEALRPELDHLCEQMEEKPEIIYMEQKLHDIPDNMRKLLQDKINELESERPEINRIVMAYGLCGKGTEGVTPSRVALVYPKVHDCIPLYMGAVQELANEFSMNGGILWLSAGMLEYGRLADHLLTERYKKYTEKFGEAKAAKMIRAENAVFANYKGACHIKWKDIKKDYSQLAQAVAKEINLAYSEMEGKPEYLAELLAGGEDEEKFLIIQPGSTLTMDTDGKIVSTAV